MAWKEEKVKGKEEVINEGITQEIEVKRTKL